MKRKVIADFTFYDLEGSLESLISYFQTILKEHEKEYHNIQCEEYIELGYKAEDDSRYLRISGVRKNTND